MSVVIVSYECADLIGPCLDALPSAFDDVPYEVIVADNGSTDATVATVRRERPSVLVIENRANHGFARANNIALGAASGEIVLLLNPDTVAQPGSLAQLARFFDTRPDAGIVAPRLCYPDGRDQETARAFPTPSAAVFGRRSRLRRLFPANRWSRAYLLADRRSSSDAFEVDWVSGACLAARRDLVTSLGGLDEGFFMHWEDADLCRRAKHAGARVYALPTATVVHHEGGSRRGWPPRQIWAFHRGAYRYYRKHHLRGALRPLSLIVGAALYARALALVTAGSLPRTRRIGPAASTAR